MKKPRTLILHTAGTNCDQESALGIQKVGGDPEIVAVNFLIHGERNILDFDFLFIPGGFSYGDDIAAGRLLAADLKRIPGLRQFIASGRPILGVCNGFQALVKAGFLPFDRLKQVASFTTNDCGSFVAKWVTLRTNHKSPCIFTKNLSESIDLPIAHGEGKFVTGTEDILARIIDTECVALTYLHNPNGSQADIAGLCNVSGNCFGLMPHPERYLTPYHHPTWTRRLPENNELGLCLLENGVRYACAV